MMNNIKNILKAVSVGASVGAIVCLLMNAIKERDAILLLGISLISLSVSSLIGKEDS